MLRRKKEQIEKDRKAWARVAREVDSQFKDGVVINPMLRAAFSN